VCVEAKCLLLVKLYLNAHETPHINRKGLFIKSIMCIRNVMHCAFNFTMFKFEHTTLDQQTHSYYTFLYLQYSRCELGRHVSIPCWDHHQGRF
jgi:hypothetical protein